MQPPGMVLTTSGGPGNTNNNWVANALKNSLRAKMKETYFTAETFTLMQNDYLIKKKKRKKVEKGKIFRFFFSVFAPFRSKIWPPGSVTGRN